MNDEVESLDWQKIAKYFGILSLAVLIGVGIYLYSRHQKQKEVAIASTQYEAMLEASSKHDNKRAEALAEELIQNYGRAPYAPLAAMLSARFSAEKGDHDTAATRLKFAIKTGEGTPTEHIARIRLARIFLCDGKYDEALAALEPKNSTEGYTTLYEEVKGDIYAKQNQWDKARISYQTALHAAPQGVVLNALQMKLDEASQP